MTLEAKETNKKEYEISFLAKNQDGGSVMENLLRQHGAEVSLKGPFAETRLAYPIKKFSQAHFGYLHFIASADAIEKIIHDANLNAAILRVLVVTPPIGKMPSGRPARSERVSSKPEAVTPAPVGGILTNEALSERLEEILK